MQTLLVGPGGEATRATERALQALGAAVVRCEPGAPLPTGLVPSLLVLVEAQTPEACARLAAAWPHTPLLVLTRQGDAAHLEALVAAGASDFLVWPGDAHQLGARLRAARARAEGEERYRLLFHTSQDPISLTCVESGRFLDVNEAWTTLYGYSREEAVGRMGPADISAEPEATRSAIGRMAEGRPCATLRRHRTREGRLVQVEVRCQSFAQGGRRVVVAFLRDVTERNRLDAQLRLADRMVSVGTLAASMAHELNNPLTYVLGNLELLASQGSPPDAVPRAQLLEEALEGARRMRVLVGDLKAFSRPDESRCRPLETREVLDASLRLLSNELRHRTRLVREDHPAPQALASASRLSQVLINLLTNALQAMPGGRPAALNEVVTGVRTGPAGQVALEVRDNGVGIPPEALPHIFEPFFTTKPVGVGTGLGLHICQVLVQEMGGQLEVESTVGVGTRFTVLLPAAPAASLRTPTPPPRAASERPLRVLLVDDEKNLAFTLRLQLAPEVELLTVSSGSEGLERVRAGEPFDAVVCDLMMPGMSGMEFHAALGTLEPRLAARCGFITGGAFTPAARDFTRALAGRVLEKPFAAEELRALVQTLVAAQLPAA